MVMYGELNSIYG